MIPLSLAKVGFQGPIQDLKGSQEIVKRLMELGFIVGEHLNVVQILFSGDPFIVKIQNAQFALRKSEADCIIVQSGTGGQ